MNAVPNGPAPTPAGSVAVPPVPAAQQPTAPIRLKGRILLAEDGIDNQQIISLYLRKAGAEVVVAENGRAAVERAKVERLDLILMDIEMPELDGYAATRRLRDAGFTLPIVALTAHCSADNRDKCIAAGCTGYLRKPVERSALLDCVAGYLSGGNRPASDAPAPAPVASESVTPTTGLRSVFADDPAMQAAIAEFIAMLPRRVVHMNKLFAEGNLAELRRAVHQIKGAGGGYGFDELTRLAAQLCCTLKQETSLETVAHEFVSLIELIRSVEGYQVSRELSHA